MFLLFYHVIFVYFQIHHIDIHYLGSRNTGACFVGMALTCDLESCLDLVVLIYHSVTGISSTSDTWCNNNFKNNIPHCLRKSANIEEICTSNLFLYFF